MKDDYFHKKARYKGFRSRASYKLFQINDKFRVFKRNQLVADLGAAPGGWSQVASRKVGSKGKVIAIDKAYLPPFKEKNIEILHKDIFDKRLSKILLEKYGNFDVLISDCAPNISGHYHRDHAVQISLASKALDIANEILIKNGNFVCKVFQGKELKDFENKVKESFKTTKLFKPKASRKRSSEIYIIGLKWMGN